MRRVKIPLRSIADTFGRSKYREYGRSNVTGKVELHRTFATINGNAYLGYGKESIAKALQAQIVDALRLGDRTRASSLLLDLGHIKQQLKAKDFVYILNYCANSPDSLFVMETWKLMEEKEIGLSNKCYSLIVQALCGGGYLGEAYNFIKFVGENQSIRPLLAVYNQFLEACAERQNLIHANQCLDLMELRRVGKDEITYIQLLKLAVGQKNLSAVHEIWKAYIKYYSPSIIALRKFIWSLTELKDLKSAYELLQHMVDLAISGKDFVSKTAEGKLYSSRLDIPIPSKMELGPQHVEIGEHGHFLALKFDTDASKIEKCKSLSSTFRIMNNGKSTIVAELLGFSFKDVIRACARARDPGLAEQLMVQMQNLGLLPTSSTYDGFLRAVIPTRGIEAVMEMLKEMEERNLKPYNSTLAVLSLECSKALELDLAEVLLDQVVKCPFTYPYNAFLRACDALDQPERAVQLLAKMRQRKVQPDIRTYELLFSVFGNVNAPYEESNISSRIEAIKRINAIESDMAQNGIQHSHLSMKNLVKALGAEGMTKELLQYLRVAMKRFGHLGASIYSTVLHSLDEAGKSHMAIEIFKYMKSCGFQLEAGTYVATIYCCRTIRCFKSACALVSMMIRDGFYPQIETYIVLIKILLDHDNFDEALNLLDQARLEGHQMDVLLYNAILKKASQEGRIDILEIIVEQMHQDKVQPDPSTCFHVFSAYVDRGFHNTAMEALQVLSMWMISDEDSTLEEKKRQFEDDFVLSEDSEAESRILRYFKHYEEHLAVALLNLRWCAMLGFPISWSPNQSQWARRLTANLNATKSTVL